MCEEKLIRFLFGFKITLLQQQRKEQSPLRFHIKDLSRL